MKIEKTVNGKGAVEIQVNGIDIYPKIGTLGRLDAPHVLLSNDLCGGGQAENWDGIFKVSPRIEFVFGKFSRDFDFRDTLHPTLPVVEFARRLADRIDQVRAWVAECKATAGTVEVVDRTEALTRLADEGRLLVRRGNGQIKVLDI